MKGKRVSRSCWVCGKGRVCRHECPIRRPKGIPEWPAEFDPQDMWDAEVREAEADEVAQWRAENPLE